VRYLPRFWCPGGWAHKSAHISKPFADDARKFLDDIFEDGRISGKKMGPNKATS
jgi:hypothetical protein